MTAQKTVVGPKRQAIVQALLIWFDASARELPWRRTRDPYAIWVSEIMLQQTQVKTVIPYWERWMKALPSILSLAEANDTQVHKLWEGLGYYTRVRNLQAAAQGIVRLHGGRFPEDFEVILDLPGVGPYTAGAIASIAFNQPRPILDGNVIRVLARLFGIADDPREKTANALLWRMAAELVQTAAKLKRPGAAEPGPLACSRLNQSLMELGALVCTPTQARCGECPVRRFCAAFRTGKVGQLPNHRPRVKATVRQFAAFILEHRGRYFVRQRQAGEVNAHLWEFPNVEVSAAGITRPVDLARQFLGEASARFTQLQTIKHSITRYRITLSGYHCALAHADRRPNLEGSWRTLRQLDSLPFSSAHRRLLEHLRGRSVADLERTLNPSD